MDTNNKPAKEKEGFDEIDEKLERLQEQNKAESIALKKLLEGLEKIGKLKTEPVKTRKKK